MSSENILKFSIGKRPHWKNHLDLASAIKEGGLLHGVKCFYLFINKVAPTLFFPGFALGITSDNKRAIMRPFRFQGKEEQFNYIHNTCGFFTYYDVNRMGLAMESWAVSCPKDTDVDSEDFPAPRDHPDRREILMFTTLDKAGNREGQSLEKLSDGSFGNILSGGAEIGVTSTAFDAILSGKIDKSKLDPTWMKLFEETIRVGERQGFIFILDL